MSHTLPDRSVGADRERVDGTAKVTGAARYAYEYPVPRPAHVFPVQATVARGRVAGLDPAAALAADGVRTVLWHATAPRLTDTGQAELAVLQSDRVHYRGQIVAAVVADTPEQARHAAALVEVSYDAEPHDTELRAGRDDLYEPADGSDDIDHGDLDAAMAAAPVTVDAVYTTPMQHANPMEPHTTTALWDDTGLYLYESTQGAHMVRDSLAPLVGLDPEQVHVTAPYVGGGFGSKGPLHAPAVLAVLAARALPGRPVKLALTRPQMFDLVGYRSPTRLRVRLAASADGDLTGVGADAQAQTARFTEFTELAASPTRMMYAAPHRRTSHRLAALDAAAPTWMRAPGECPGMFGPEVAMDELALACGTDPVELRIRNEPDTDPETGRPYSSRNLVRCLREGADLFGWHGRDPAPRARLRDGWWRGTGVAASTYPTLHIPGSTAEVRYEGGGTYTVLIGAADIGTGAWTALTQVAADALSTGYDTVQVLVGDTDLPKASLAGGSTGLSSWGTAVVAAAEEFRARHGTDPAPGDRAQGTGGGVDTGDRYAKHAFGAQFAEVAVHADTGEVRVERLLGVFAAGRIINPRTARSQFLGAMTMGVSMALHEHSVVDHRFGHVINHDFADYHIAVGADVPDVRAHWVDEHDPHINPLGAKGIGEIGITGTAAAIVNAAHHATGVRVRDLPMTLDRFLG